MANFYSMRYFYTSTILWNQIVLNYILYCDNLVRFEITSPYYFPGYPRLIIPLYIETETNKYFFSYLKYVNEETLHKVFLNWDDFQKNSKLHFHSHPAGFKTAPEALYLIGFFLSNIISSPDSFLHFSLISACNHEGNDIN